MVTTPGTDLDLIAAAPRDPHPWRAALLLSAIVVAAGMLFSMWLMPRLDGDPRWWINGDAWVPFYGARYVASGAFPYLYDAHDALVAGPLLSVVLAPAAALADALHLTDNLRFNVPRPTAWLVYAPYGLALSTLTFLVAVRSLAAALSDRSHGLLRIQIASVGLVVVPVGIVFSHYEDLFALGLLLLAVRECLEGRTWRSALALGAAVAFKQWALLGAPALVVWLPPRERIRWAAAATAIPAIAYGIPLVVDWTHASTALFDGKAWPTTGHPAPWVADTSVPLTGTGFRSLAVLTSIVVGWSIRRRTEPSTLVAALGVVFVLRLAFEPVLFAAYLGPPIAFALLHRRASSERLAGTALVATAMLALFPLHPSPPVWWILEGLLAIALVRRPARELLPVAARSPRPGRTLTAAVAPPDGSPRAR